MFFLVLMMGCSLNVPVSVESEPITVEGNLLCPDPGLAEVLPDSLQTPVLSLIQRGVQGAFDLLGTEIEAAIAAQDTGPAKHVTLREVTLLQSDPPDAPSAANSLGFLEGLDLDLDEVRMAWAQEIPEATTSLSLEHDPETDLLPALDAGAVVRATPTLRSCPRQDITLTVAVEVSAEL